MRYPTTFDEYVRYFDVVPTDARSYLRRFRPDDASRIEWQSKSPGECARLLRKSRQAAAASPAPPVKATRFLAQRRPVRKPSRAVPPAAVPRTAAPVIGKRAAGSSPGVLVGYAAMYGKPSVNLGGFVETLAPGAFRSTLDRIKAGEHDLFLLTEHTQQNILARVTAGNLRVAEDATGLRFTVELPDTQLGRDVRELIDRGILRGMSFSFATVRESWPQPGQRTVHDLTAFEISIVSTPAYPATSVMLSRSAVPDDVAWRAARMKALSARPVRCETRHAGRRSVGGIEWR